MDSSITVQLNTSADLIAAWLIYYLRGLKTDLGDSYGVITNMIVRKKRLPFRRDGAYNGFLIVCDARRVRKETDPEIMEEVVEVFPRCLICDVTALANERVRVDLECEHVRIAPIVDVIATELVKDYPEGFPTTTTSLSESGGAVDAAQGQPEEAQTTTPPAAGYQGKALFNHLTEIATGEGTIKERLKRILEILQAAKVKMDDEQLAEMLGSTPKTMQRYRSDFFYTPGGEF